MQTLTTGDAIVAMLRDRGVDTIFGIPGVHTYDLFDALSRATSPRLITPRHEQGAAYMAYGYAKSSGRVGVYSVVPGPGILNAGAAMCTALGACTQMLGLTAEIPAAYIGLGRGILHELPNQLATLRSINKWAGRINAPAEAPAVLDEAFRQMQTGRPGPAVVETPWDVLGQSAVVDLTRTGEPISPPEPDPDAIRRAVTILKGARNPMISVGAGALHAGEEILRLAKLLQAPVTAHRSGRGIVSEDTPYGMSCGEALGGWLDTDVLIGIGSRLELQYLRWRKLPAGLQVIRIDIDSTEFQRLPATVGILADAKAGAAALVHELELAIDRRPNREEEFSARKCLARGAFREVQPQQSYLEVMREVLPTEGIFVEEISQVGFTARYAFPVYAPRRYVTCGYQENLGFGFNTALGVKVAHPRVPVLAIAGDGGFMFGVQELATAAQYGINVVICVFDNGGFGNVRRDQMTNFSGRVIGADLRNPDFLKLAESFGVDGYTAASPTALRTALEQAFAADRPAVIHIPVPRGTEASPWRFLHPVFED